MVMRADCCSTLLTSLRMLVVATLLFFALFAQGTRVQAQVSDPEDPLGGDLGALIGENLKEPDEGKSAQELLLEAAVLMKQGHMLDGRTKLLHTLEKDPKEYRAHLMLASYYLSDVGHFRLALKYIKQAQAVFFEKYGEPPYRNNFEAQSTHAEILYYLSQARLNLDDYQGALAALDEFTRWGYFADWYQGSRAWILMKLGRLDQAITVARVGLLTNAATRERGQILNMLGILLSMNRQRDESLRMFEEAVRFEFSEGESGRPATPLNNAGEVYNESFDEDKAEASWLKATSLPDGCEHVLPSLNLAILYIQELDISAAARAIDRFEECVAQFPLRNGEEHRALVHLARGRIDLYRGNIDSAISHLEDALSNQQWFGKIGTNADDLRAGATLSLAQALRAKVAVLGSTPTDSVGDWISNESERITDTTRAWWLMRRARQILAEDLNNFEDLYVRNTDSLLEYSTLGDVIEAFPSRAATARIKSEREKDPRAQAAPYYDAYLAQNYFEHGSRDKAYTLVKTALEHARLRYDKGLRLKLELLLLNFFAPDSNEYRRVASEVFSADHAALRNAGFRLPINYVDTTGVLSGVLEEGPFVLDNTSELQYLVKATKRDGHYELEFSDREQSGTTMAAIGDTPAKAVQALSTAIFSVAKSNKHAGKPIS